MTSSRTRRAPDRPALHKRLREQLTRRYDDRPINDQEPPLRWM